MSRVLSDKEIVWRENVAVVVIYPVILLLSGIMHTIYNPTLNQFAQAFLISFIYLIGFLGLLQIYHAPFRVKEKRPKFVWLGFFMVLACYVLIETAYLWLNYIVG